jgi:hypothetical protein
VNRGTLLRGVIGDMASPIVYGYDVNQLPIYFSGGALLDAGAPTTPEAKPVSTIDVLRPGSSAALSGAAAGGGGIGAAARRSSVYQNTTPMATWVEKSRWDPMQTWPADAIGARRDARLGGRTLRWRRRVDDDAAGDAPARRGAVPGESARHAALGRPRGGEHLSNRPTVLSQRLGDRPARALHHASILALADAGHVHDGVQRHHALERSERERAA